MKKLTNKKGFTLIEMLVVIAIIAILVAIIIPVVQSSTTKAAAATDAANLRSYKAEITTHYLSKDGKVTVDASGTVSGLAAPAMKEFTGVPANATVNATIVDDVVTVTYGGYHIADFAKVAETGDALAHVNNCGGNQGGQQPGGNG